jgi:hypothetical protein
MRDTECIRTLPGPTVDGMTTTILATIGAVVLLLETATRVPPALTDLVRALIPTNFSASRTRPRSFTPA